MSGLSGTGKTTIGKALAAKRRATYVRIDEIENALVQNTALGRDVGPAGYIVAFTIARSNLELGNVVVADGVNPVLESRQGWRSVAEGSGIGILEIEVVCSNQDEHRRRVENRKADIAGFDLPSWASVQAREYTPWTTARLVIDTFLLSLDDAIAEIETWIDTIS